jgi:hypothetical protein
MNRTQVNAAAGGTQQYLVISDVPSGSTASHREALMGALLKNHTLNVAGAYVCDIDIRGLRRCELHLRASDVTGTVTPSAYTTYCDGTTQKTVSAPAGDALVAAARQSLVFAEGELVGESTLRLTITVGGGASATFDQAEINGL